jgi:opacity protein-like surface antigen
MKKLLTVALFVIASLSATAAQAGHQHRIGADGAFDLMKFDFGSDIGSETFFGIGGLFRYEYLGISPQLAITARVGYIFGLTKEISGVDTSVSLLPFLGGIKYHFTGFTSGKREGFYAGAELGLFIVKSKVDAGAFGSRTFSDEKLGLTAGVGYEVSNFDIGARFLAPSIGDLGDIMGLLVTVGYSFFSF